MLTVARFNVWGGSMFCLILVHPWDMWLNKCAQNIVFKKTLRIFEKRLWRAGVSWDCLFLQDVVALSHNPSTPITLAAGPTQVPGQPGIFSEDSVSKEKKSQPLNKCAPGLPVKMRQHWSGYRGHAYTTALCKDECYHRKQWWVSSELNARQQSKEQGAFRRQPVSKVREELMDKLCWERIESLKKRSSPERLCRVKGCAG